jgi:putative transposase
MRKKRYSETQIVKILKEAAAAHQTVEQVCRRAGISQATYYKWRSKYGGMEASDIQRLKELEAENRRLKQMYADLSLEHNTLKGLLEKNV